MSSGSRKKRAGLGRVRYRAKKNPSGKWAKFLENLTMICHYCGSRLHFEEKAHGRSKERMTALSLDHIWCEAIYGKSCRSENFVESCATCNSLKGTLDYFEFSLFAEFYLKPLRIKHSDIHSYNQLARLRMKEFFGEEVMHRAHGNV